MLPSTFQESGLSSQMIKELSLCTDSWWSEAGPATLERKIHGNLKAKAALGTCGVQVSKAAEDLN